MSRAPAHAPERRARCPEQTPGPSATAALAPRALRWASAAPEIPSDAGGRASVEPRRLATGHPSHATDGPSRPPTHPAGRPARPWRRLARSDEPRGR